MKDWTRLGAGVQQEWIWVRVRLYFRLDWGFNISNNLIETLKVQINFVVEVAHRIIG